MSPTKTTLANEKVYIAAAEKIPYISQSQSNQGYVYEVLQHAFERSGYEVDIDFYPLARAKKLVLDGRLDGYLTLSSSNQLKSNKWLSQPFPAGQMGLLKRIDNPQPLYANTSTPILQQLMNVNKFQFSMVRGSDLTDVKEYVPESSIQWVVNELQNIDVVAAQRTNFAIIDKFSAGDLIVSRRPHLIGKLEFLPTTIADQQFHINFSNESPRNTILLKAFNSGLQHITADGTLDTILAKYGFFPSSQKSDLTTKLVIGAVDSIDILLLKEVSKLYEEQNPTVHLEWRLMNETTLRTRVLTDLALSDGQFDVMTIGAYETPIWAKQQWLTALENLPKSYDIEDIVKPVRNVLSISGNFYGLPINAESSVLYYRKDLFLKAGLSLPIQFTYETLIEYSKQLHQIEDGVSGICLRGKPSWGESIALISTIAQSYGGTWFDSDWRPQLNTPQWKKALEVYILLTKNYGPAETSNKGFNELLTLFSSGRCAIWIDSSVAAGTLFNPNTSQVSEDVAVTKAPSGYLSAPSEWFWTWAFAIPTSSKHKLEATKFITWATSKEYIKHIARNKGIYSVPSGTRYSTYDTRFSDIKVPYSAITLSTIEASGAKYQNSKAKPYLGIQYASIKEFPAIGNQVADLIDQVVREQLTVDEALKASQAIAEKQMKASGYY
ncbi:extracellular solute-binding protein [Alteromonas sp. 5E99-2]|uniref:extracellular solute-binding protein n=1 Tax=Alteromonas sp. 5E99-2 TaxID=2817683 RepID=UPI001A99EB93|nr:extracellular solute-binding protein [Alteromonas sp. 5E99-2]MBO1255757.1 extracellular solute-binding protein [Alteromonas sp. 5E99-2]